MLVCVDSLIVTTFERDICNVDNHCFFFSPSIYRCGYQAIVTQWDFNWLSYLGVIRHSLTEQQLKEHYDHLFVARSYKQ